MQKVMHLFSKLRQTDGCMPILAGGSQMKSICCGWSPADAHANGAPSLQKDYVIEIAMTYGEKPLMCHALIRAVPVEGHVLSVVRK